MRLDVNTCYGGLNSHNPWFNKHRSNIIYQRTQAINSIGYKIQNILPWCTNFWPKRSSTSSTPPLPSPPPSPPPPPPPARKNYQVCRDFIYIKYVTILKASHRHHVRNYWPTIVISYIMCRYDDVYPRTKYHIRICNCHQTESYNCK